MKHSYRVFEAGLTAETCDRIVALGESLKSAPGTVRRDPKNDVRNSTVSWIRKGGENDWVFDAIGFYVNEANSAHWSWNITNVETLQYTRYGPGQYYEWHADQREEPYGIGSRWPGLTRKLSVTVQLSEGEEYEGGDFQLEEVQRPPDKMATRIKQLVARKRGTVVVFPSFLFHRVTPVTSGMRRSLVAWYLGPPWV